MSTKTTNPAKMLEQIPLYELAIEHSAKVSHIAAGREATHRLSGMGITVGAEIIVLSKAPFHGPLQIQVRGTRIALGRGLAKKIFVSH